MAEQQRESSQIATTFPDPPPFWKDFTPDKLARIDALRAERGSQDRAEGRIPSMPPDLINLQPPAEPADGKWRVFGESYTLNDELQSLEAAGIRRLGLQAPSSPDNKDGTHADRGLELKKMAKSLLLNYIELIGTMSINPEQGEKKAHDIQELLLNFHHVLNEYRPHQARESLIMLMQDQLDKKRAETQAIRKVTENAKRELAKLADIVIPEVDGTRPAPAEAQPPAKANAGSTADDRHWARQKALWNRLDAEFG